MKWSCDCHLRLFLLALLNNVGRCSFGGRGLRDGGLRRVISCLAVAKVWVGVGATLVSVYTGVDGLSCFAQSAVQQEFVDKPENKKLLNHRRRRVEIPEKSS